MFVEKIKNRKSGIVLYGIVPPKKGSDTKKIEEISNLQMQRIGSNDLDGLILYDIQDEAERTCQERPFPFLETVDSFTYSREYLSSLSIPKIIYRAVGKHSPAELSRFLMRLSPENESTVFVGASSGSQKVTMPVSDAYKLWRDISSQVVLGGVTIPERHRTKTNEHIRVFEKISNGCSFFVSQGVYDVNASKDLLSDYYYYGKERGIPLVPIIFTLTPCGSKKTLQFMSWLGISIPRWLENDLIHSKDILQRSVDCSEENWKELKDFADEKGYSNWL